MQTETRILFSFHPGGAGWIASTDARYQVSRAKPLAIKGEALG